MLFRSYADFVGDSEFDRYERPSSPIDPSTYIAPSIHIVQTTAYDQLNVHPYKQNTSNLVPTCFSDEEHNIKSRESDYGSSNILCTPVNSEDDEEHPKYIEFRAEVDMPDPIFEKGMMFSDHKEFKRAVQSYRIKHGYPLLIVKNESRKVSYKCENCEWYIYASWDRKENFLLLKTYREKHTRSRAFHSRMVSTRWIAVAWLKVFRGRTNIKSVEIKEGIKNQFQVDISLNKAFRAKYIALEMLKGRFAYQFERARDYCEELKVSNLSTTAKINLHTPTLHFKRMYMCLAACRTRFLEECRLIISLDTCHLRGFLKERLLATVGIDGNDGMYSIAFAVCEGETKDSWSGFLELLLANIGPMREHCWTFTSNQQKVCISFLCKFNVVFIVYFKFKFSVPVI